MARSIKERTIEILVGLILAILVVGGVALYLEPQPYKYLKVTAGPMYSNQDVLPVEVDIFRTKSCPYIIERTVYDATGHKRFDRRETFSAPQVTGGSDLFRVDVHLVTEPEPGQGIYSARIGTMCNPVQVVFPNWGQGWYNIPFDVIPSYKQNGES